MTITQSIKCARCRWSLRGPPKPKPYDRLTCPRCGNGDTLANIMIEVRQYIEQLEAHENYSALIKTASNNGQLEAIRERPPRRAFRFIVVRQP